MAKQHVPLWGRKCRSIHFGEWNAAPLPLSAPGGQGDTGLAAVWDGWEGLPPTEALADQGWLQVPAALWLTLWMSQIFGFSLGPWLQFGNTRRSLTLWHRWQTQGPRAESGPPLRLIWPGTLFLPGGSTKLSLNC